MLGRLKRKLRARAKHAVWQAANNHLLYNHRVFGDESAVSIAPGAVVNDALFNVSSGRITVEEEVFFGHSVMLLTGTHDYRLRGAERRLSAPRSGRDIVIEHGAWISSGAIVLGPCRIGRDAVVAAGAVVTRDVPEGAVVAGNPAVVVKHIDDDRDGRSPSTAP